MQFSKPATAFRDAQSNADDEEPRYMKPRYVHSVLASQAMDVAQVTIASRERGRIIENRCQLGSGEVVIACEEAFRKKLQNVLLTPFTLP